MNTNIKLAIWDLDNTLLETELVFKQSMKMALTYLKILDEQQRFCLLLWERFLRYFAETDYVGVLHALDFECKWGNISNQMLEDAAKEGLKVWDSGVPVYPQCEDCLSFLKKNDVKLAIVTNGNRVFQFQKIKIAGLDYYFPESSVYVGSALTPDGKPNPTLLIKCCNDFGEDPGNAVYIGDRVTDIIAANLASALSIYIEHSPTIRKRPPVSRKLAIETPTYKVDNYAELLSLFQNRISYFCV